jgi:hypothetical protein
MVRLARQPGRCWCRKLHMQIAKMDKRPKHYSEQTVSTSAFTNRLLNSMKLPLH